ncbi:murein hydrolase activator EnvC [Marinoscillum sp. MHG1-6]|uniref:murein hydrolase activator EnvC family protein n=1 Tax=Marinoscillum sp. MHG1-6 TaxID=2959627 RepID=UPI0021576AF6|nr:peptidoglycan DD-metalloendopeptidase family protein [Marinoscillum sp. MHG1-6]
MKLTSVLGLLLFFFICFPSLAQKTKSQLEQEKRENLKKIAEAEKILSDTEHQKKASIGQLNALNQQIKARERLISGLNQEVGLLDGEIGDLNIIISALQSDLKDLKDEYAQMIYSSYKANRGFSKLTFLFSANTFNQLFMRLKYLEQYSEARQLQVRQIEIVSEELIKQKSQVEIKKSEQQLLLDQQIAENRKLLGLKVKQNSLVTELSKKEKQIRKELAQRKVAVEKLDNLIAEIVRKEMERSKALSSAAAASEEEISSLFEGNKNRLKWPVATGFISSKFGKHPHPVIKGIIEDNPGVDIQTSQNAPVNAVFEGKVVAVAIVPGMNNVVLLQHGNYYTLYARLKDVKVKKGQNVSSNETLGTVFSDKDGVSEVHFEVWKEYQKLNPESWLSMK